MTIKVFSCFSFGGYFVQRNKTIIEIFIEGHSKHISMKLFLKWVIELQEDLVFFFFLLWRPLCSAEQDDFSQFW